jgi:hypothetical protein
MKMVEAPSPLFCWNLLFMRVFAFAALGSRVDLLFSKLWT